MRPLLWLILTGSLTSGLAGKIPLPNAGLAGVRFVLMGTTLVPTALSGFNEVRVLRRCQQLTRQAPSRADLARMDTTAAAQVAAAQRALILSSWGLTRGAAGACAAACNLWVVAVPLVLAARAL